MPKILLICLLMALTFGLQAQSSRLPATLVRRELLKELQLSQWQRAQLQELVRQERVEKYLQAKKLKEILTPAQFRKLLEYQKQHPATAPAAPAAR